jgi:hypothetical protein
MSMTDLDSGGTIWFPAATMPVVDEAIAAAEARGYDRAVAMLRAIRAEFSRNSDSDAILTDAIRQLDATKETDHA